MRNNTKRSRSDDRLSELPDSLIFHIFWLLPIRDVIWTTKLSRRWRNLWTTSPFLNFSDYYHHGPYNRYEASSDKVRNFYNRALILWRGAKLLKFKVIFRDRLSMPLIGDINFWVRFAKEKEVSELYLDLDYPCEGDDNDLDAEFESLCSCLCSFSSLEVLLMKNFPFSIGNGNVKWVRLKCLTIDTYHFGQYLFSKVFGQYLFSKVLCGSPKLEVFNLTHNARGGNCYIRSSSLKKLSIKKLLETEFERNTEMKIQTPNLETLEISGVPYKKFSLYVSPLTDVTLGLCCENQSCDYGESGSFDFSDVKGMLEQILPTIQHVESLTLSGCCLEVLGVMNKKSLLSPLSKVKFLRLNDSSHVQIFSKHLEVAGLLQIFPQLKRLVIEDDFEGMVLSEDENEDDYQDDRESLEFEANLPNSLLLQLRTVEVTWGGCDKSIFSFIKILLKYASKLEKMVFRFRVNRFRSPSHASPHVFLASRKLLRMTRSSPTAQIILCKP